MYWVRQRQNPQQFLTHWKYGLADRLKPFGVVEGMPLADSPITDAERALLDARLADMESNPEDWSPWTEVKARLESKESLVIVIVKSHRLILRQFTLDDASFIFTLLNDPAFLHFIGDKGVRTIEDARNYLTNGPIASYQRNGFGPYLVELKDTKTPIGMCGLLKRDALEHVDLGFAFMPDYRRQGYGFEAATAVLSHTKDVHGFDRILAITNPDNHSSIKLLEKLGFEFERMIRLPGDTSEIKLFAMSDKL